MGPDGHSGEVGSSADDRITRLHEVATELQSAQTEEGVYNAVIDAAVEILGFDACAISVPDDGVFDERVVSDSAPFEEGTRSYRLDEGHIGKAYQTGDSILLEDESESPDAKPSDEGIVSGITVPLEDVAVFQGYSGAVGAFDETDLEVAELLCTHATVALHRIERDQQLQRKTEQLEQFASFVSHDLRNPLNVATLQLDLAQREVTLEEIDAAVRALERMETLLDELLSLSMAGDQINELEQVNLGALASTCLQTVDTGDATLVTETAQTIHADRNRLQQLLENLIRNSVEHGLSDDTVDATGTDSQTQADDGTLTIRIGGLENGGFYVADNGPGIPEDEREQVFESGYSTADNGTGYGLAIVTEIAEAHDWSVTVTESVDGGARFEFRT